MRLYLGVIGGIALAAVAGCSSAGSTSVTSASGGSSPAAAPGSTGSAAAGQASYWTEERLKHADDEYHHALQTPSPGSTPEARQNAKALRIGALFNSDSSGSHFCSASVVDSPHKDVIVTAAHCLNDGKGGGNKENIVFIPGYANGSTPNGVWTPKSYYMDSRWTNGANDKFDVAFLDLKQLDGKAIQDVIGGNKIEFNAGYDHYARVAGYPGSADAPIACWNFTSQFEDFLKFNCAGFYSGTSGSPFVTDFDKDTREGTVVGVLGGYLEGGDVPETSYSDYLGDD